MIPNTETVIRAMRDVAAAEIMPRFGRLQSGDISAKKPTDLVTTADIEAERRLVTAFTALVPNSVVVGEEGSEADPALLLALKGDKPVWLVDPVDGTNNYVNGKPCFAVIVGYCLYGETVAGWILDPVTDIAVWAVRGEGAWLARGNEHRRLYVSERRDIRDMTGIAGLRLAKRVMARSEQGLAAAPRKVARSGSTGRDYMELAQGTIDFAQWTRLKPWDHAAGVLIHGEAGGFSRITQMRAPYRPADGIIPHTVLLAPDETGWKALHTVFEAAAADLQSIM